MARVKKVMELIEKSIGHIDSKYDICVSNVDDIRKISQNPRDMICNGFRFGYMQGMKAAEAKKKEATGCKR